MNCEVFPLISLLRPFVVSLPFTASSVQVFCSSLAFTYTDFWNLLSGKSVDVNGWLPRTYWLKKPASIWNKSPDLATHTNNLDTAKWLPPLCRWKDEEDFSWMPNGEAMPCCRWNSLYYESELMSLTGYSSGLPGKALVKFPFAPRFILHYGKPYFPSTGTLRGFVGSKW